MAQPETWNKNQTVLSLSESSTWMLIAILDGNHYQKPQNFLPLRVELKRQNAIK